MKKHIKPGVGSILETALQTFNERKNQYGESTSKVAECLSIMFPDGHDLNTPEDFSRFCKFVWILTKLCRYSESIHCGGHKDSAHDMIVYAAMLEEVTDDN